MDARLPAELQFGIQQLLHATSRNELSERSARISEGYRRYEPSGSSVRSSADVMAYILSRLPATYAAVATAIGKLASEYPDFAPSSLLDMGAGPGTAAWAACEVWPSLRSATLVDHNPEFLGIARQLSATSRSPALQSANFELAEISTYSPIARYDLVMASYAMTELADVKQAAANLFKSTDGLFIVIEPGRPRDYERLMEARRHLSETGRIIGPCPHSDDCPLPAGDWCHFSVRLPRTRDHMHTKNATVPFEDERFSYLAVCPKDSSLQRAPFSRVLAPPKRTKHNVIVKLCSPAGLKSHTTRSQERVAFKRMKKLEWGDTLEE